MGVLAPTADAPLSTRPIDRFFQVTLLVMLSAGHLAMVSSRLLDLPSVIVTCAAISLRFAQLAGWRGFIVSDRAALVAALAYVGFWPLDYLFISADFLQATVHLVCFLASMMILRARTPRDYFFVQIIAFLELLVASILSTGPAFFIFLVIFLMSAVATMASGEIRGNVSRPQVIARSSFRGFAFRLSVLSAFVFIGVITLTAAFFFVLPRTARAAFQHLWSDRFFLPGFSNEVLLGQIGEIRKSSRPVMHTRFLTEQRPERPLWRGAALIHFDGKRWFNEPEAPERINLSNGGAQLGDVPKDPESFHRFLYEVQIDSVAGSTLFFAGNPLFITIDADYLLRTRTGTYRVPEGLRRGLRYFGTGVLTRPGVSGGEEEIDLPLDARITYIMLPNVDSRIISLARRITAPYPDAAGKAAAIERYLRATFPYTDELPEEKPEDPLAHFLFERRKGHCEYFASAMAVMLRIVYVPSRVVTGFQAGVYNPVSGWNLVRTSDAHSWVEAFIPGRGWVSYDPTPPAPEPERLSVWAKLGMYLDAAELFWHDWVVSYDLERQWILADRMGASGRNFSLNWHGRLTAFGGALKNLLRELWVWTPFIIPGLVLAAVFARFVLPGMLRRWNLGRRMQSIRRGDATVSDATILYRRMLDRLASRGVEKPAWVTPNEFLEHLRQREDWPIIADLTEAYNQLRFGGRREAAARMAMLLEQLEGRRRA